MMLPALLKRTGAAAKLERANAELAKADAAIAELQSRLASLDVESEDYAQSAATLNAQISVQIKALNVLSLQITGLHRKVELEERAEKERRRVADLAKIEQLLPRWMEAAAKFEKWLKSGDAALAALTEARRQIVHEWPVEVEKPYSFFMDVMRAIRMLRAAIGPNGVDAEAADGFAAHERELMAQLLDGLKQQPKPDEEKAA